MPAELSRLRSNASCPFVQTQSKLFFLNCEREVVPFCAKLALSPIHNCLIPAFFTPH